MERIDSKLRFEFQWTSITGFCEKFSNNQRKSSFSHPPTHFLRESFKNADKQAKKSSNKRVRFEVLSKQQRGL